MANIKALLKSKEFRVYSCLVLVVGIPIFCGVIIFLVKQLANTLPANDSNLCQNVDVAGDGICDDKTNTVQCNYDGGDCCDPTSSYDFCLVCLCVQQLGESNILPSFNQTNEIGYENMLVVYPDRTTMVMSLSLKRAVQNNYPEFLSFMTVYGIYGTVYNDSIIFLKTYANVYDTSVKPVHIYQISLGDSTGSLSTVPNSSWHIYHKQGVATLLGDKIMLAGGLLEDPSQEAHGFISIWDFSEGSWRRASSDLPSGKIGLCLETLNDTHVIIAGGSINFDTVSNRVFVYDVINDKFVEIAKLPISLKNMRCSVIVDGGEKFLLLAGGQYGSNIGTTYLRTTFLLDLTNLERANWQTPNGHELPYEVDLGYMVSVGSKVIFLPGYVLLQPYQIPREFLIYDRKNGWKVLFENFHRVIPGISTLIVY